MLTYNRLPWFPFSPSDWITLCANRNLSIPAQGVLIRLMCYQWLEGHIPADHKEIKGILGGYSGDGFLEAIDQLRPIHSVARQLHFPPLTSAREEAIATSLKRKAAGRKGGLKTQSRLTDCTSSSNRDEILHN